MNEFPVVCLCGSSRFKEQWEEAAKEETRSGKIVLTIHLYGHVDGLDMEGKLKQTLDKMHFQRIDMASEILVIDVEGYIGYSTRNEINYATEKGKKIRYWSHEQANKRPDSKECW